MKMQNTGRNRNPSIDFRIIGSGEILQIILSKFGGNSTFRKNIRCFIIGNRSLFLCLIMSNDIIALHMNDGFKFLHAAQNVSAHALVPIDNLNVEIAKIRLIAVDKTIIPVQDCMRTDAITIQNIDLRSVIGDKKMLSPLHDFMGRIIKEIVNIEFIDKLTRKIIKKVPLLHVNRRGNIDSLISVDNM